MEKIFGRSISDIFEQDFLVVELIKYWNITDVVRYRQISKRAGQAIEQENYALFLKLRDYLHIPYTYNSSDLASRQDILGVFRKVIEALQEEAQHISAFAFYTDGGVDTNSNYYFLQNVWKKTGIGYGTVAHSNVHVQSVLSKSVDMPTADNNPMNFLENPKDKNIIRIPYEDYIVEPRDDPFHILTNFQVLLRTGGYNAYVETFAVFYSEQEIENSKFQSLTKKFDKVFQSTDLSKLQLDICHEQDNTDDGIKIVEFDVSKSSAIEKGFKSKSYGFYPLLWINVKKKYVNKTVNYKIKQFVAAKFVSLKLIKSSNENVNSNIDLYNLDLKGIPIRLENSDLD